jgi:Tfp pilus assembly protein FimT
MGVLVILALVATIVSVNWTAILPRANLHAAVRTLASTLSGTRSEAIARNATFQIQYNLDLHQYRVVTPFRQDGEGLAVGEEDRRALQWTPLPKGVQFQVITIDGVEYKKGLVYVRFDALGTASGHSIVLVQMPYDAKYTIEVQGLLGLVDYREGVWSRPPPKEGDFR